MKLDKTTQNKQEYIPENATNLWFTLSDYLYDSYNQTTT